MNIARIIKRIELYTYRRYMEYSRSKYATYDLQRKLKNISICPISKELYNEIRAYYKQYGLNINKKWYDLFNSLAYLNQSNDVKNYIQHDIYYKYIDPYFSDVRKCGFVDDKSLYGIYFHDIPQPRTILMVQNNGADKLYLDEKYRIVTKDDAKKLVGLHDQLIIKKSTYSSGGYGVWFYNAEVNSSEEILETTDSIIIQEILPQHDILCKLHENSLNTIRIITLIFNDEVYVLSSILRMGQGGAKVDNASSGGLFCGIEANGRLKNIGFDCNGQLYNKHPGGAHFNDIMIPNFDKCISLVKCLAPRLSSFTKLCSWDIAINKDGSPILIEANMTFGEVDFHQICNGPIFGDLTKDVLKKVFIK